MAGPAKTDATTPCECGDVMKITAVAPVPDAKLMAHTFECPSCGKMAQFRFPEKAYLA